MSASSLILFLVVALKDIEGEDIKLGRGTLGVAEHRITAKKFDKYRNTAKKSENTAIL